MEDRALPFIRPDDPKPVSLDALQARRRAIREGRIIAPPRDEFERDEAVRLAQEAKAAEAEAAEAAAKAEAEAAEAAAKAEAEAAEAAEGGSRSGRSRREGRSRSGRSRREGGSRSGRAAQTGRARLLEDPTPSAPPVE